MSNPGARKCREMALERYYSNPSVCLNCDKVIEVKDDERPWDAKRRKFCNKSCSASYNNKKTKKKVPVKCLCCGVGNSNRSNKFCSLKCGNEYRYRSYIERWLAGDETGNINNDAISVSAYVRRWLFEKHDSKCESCGWSEMSKYSGKIPLTIHHNDGDCANTTPDNVSLLCPNCHSLTMTYGNLNRGNSKRIRKRP